MLDTLGRTPLVFVNELKLSRNYVNVEEDRFCGSRKLSKGSPYEARDDVVCRTMAQITYVRKTSSDLPSRVFHYEITRYHNPSQQQV